LCHQERSAAESKNLHLAILAKGWEAITLLIGKNIRGFSEDEYQACSGIGNGANKKTVVVERKDPAGAEAHLYFVAFASRLKSCPVTKHCPFIPWAAEPELT
jgi:hypothetical protein